MRKRRSTYFVSRPALTDALDMPARDVLARSRDLYRSIEVHGIALAPRAIELLLTAPSRPQLAGFLQHLFRNVSSAVGGGIYVGRVRTIRLLTSAGVMLHTAGMQPFLLRDVPTTPLPVRLGGPPPVGDLFAC